MNDDVQELREKFDRQLDHVFKELRRLRKENARLMDENKALREEVTLERLQGDGGRAAPRGELSAPGSHRALTFYHRLPASVPFSGFFRRADAFGLSSKDAKNFLLYFIECDLLVPHGAHVRKPRLAPYAMQ